MTVFYYVHVHKKNNEWKEPVCDTLVNVDLLKSTIQY